MRHETTNPNLIYFETLNSFLSSIIAERYEFEAIAYVLRGNDASV